MEYAGELKELWPRILEAVFDIPEDDLRLSCVRLIKETVSLFFSMEFTYRNPFCMEELYGFILKTNHIDTELNYIYAQHFQTLQNPELKIIRQKISELEKKAEWLTVEGKRDTQEYEETDRQLEAARVEVLKALSGSKAGSVFEQMKLEDIQQTLEENEVILEYVRYSQIKSKQRTTMDFVDCYCGFVITKASITLYFLDTCEKIDAMINDFITKMEAGQDVDGLLDAIAEILLGRFHVCSGNTSTVYIVPDSVLYKLPFELLTDRIWPVEDSVPRSVIYLSSGRDLLRNTRAPEKYKILILANPQYNLDEESEGHDGAVNNAGIRYFGNEKIAPDPDTLPPLQFSEAEAQRIAKVFGENSATVLTGKNASATALLAETDTDILHIATHGFACQSENHHSSSAVNIMSERIHYFENCEDPLLRCGLYFAGASNWLRGGELPDIYGDGVLLGHDLAAMELSQYRLVVLSACQTAEGDVHTGEGLKGLRHAFELAGVGCLICTLWKVDDLASALLMDQFYQELLITGTLPSEALARAKQYVRTITAGELVQAGWDEYLNDDVIDHLMREGLTDYANYLQDILDIPDMQPFAHPRYWAGFIIQGHCIRQM